MKKRILAFLVLSLVVIQVRAQWGLNAGSSFTKFTADGSTMGVGVYAGAFYDLNIISENIYFRPSLVYHYDRATAKAMNSHKTSFDMHYVKIPLNFSYHIKLNQNNYLNPYLGGYIYCGLYGKFTDKYDFSSVKSSTTYDQLERFNYGLTGGLEYELKGHYLLNIEYNIGINDVLKSGTSGGFPDYLKRLNSINVGVGYKF